MSKASKNISGYYGNYGMHTPSLSGSVAGNSWYNRAAAGQSGGRLVSLGAWERATPVKVSWKFYFFSFIKTAIFHYLQLFMVSLSSMFFQSLNVRFKCFFVVDDVSKIFQIYNIFLV